MFKQLLKYTGWHTKCIASLGQGMIPSLKSLLTPITDKKNSDKPASTGNTQLTPLPRPHSNQTPSTSAQLGLFAKAPLISDPIRKLRLFLPSDYTASEAQVKYQALALVIMQYFQSYYMTGRDQLISQVSIEQARRIRNAFVHQHMPHSHRETIHLLLDGEETHLLILVELLIKAHETKDGNQLIKSPLFVKALQQGTILSNQQRLGEREHVTLYQRLLYTQWLQNMAAALEHMHFGEGLQADMLLHAKVQISILKQVYCLKQSSHALTELEAEQAKIIRHLTHRLTLVKKPNNENTNPIPDKNLRP